MSIDLTCYACGSSATLADGARCACGEPYWIETDPGTFAWPDTAERSQWRYRDLLPTDPPVGLGACVGGTSLVRAPRLDDDIEARVHVKYEGTNPTGTFKDRGSAIGVSVAAERGYEAVGTVSHGNMARSMAAHAASEGLDCLVLVPADIPTSRLGLMTRHDPTIRRVEGDYGDLYYEALRLGRQQEVAFVNSDTPLRVAGQKTTGLEIAESFAPEVPEAIVMPVSSGGHASGVWKGFRELSAAGLIGSIPPLFFVQAAACSPIADAWARGDETVSPVEGGETVAYSIANRDPPSGNRVLAAAADTGGEVLAVDDEAIVDARRAIAERAGLSVESSCATVLAGARKVAAEQGFDDDADIVLVATGTGFTDTDTTDIEVTAPTVPMADLDATFEEIA